MSRLALTDADKEARDWFVATTEALGCHVTVDSMGNIFAVRPGIRNDKPPTFVGSHLDTQPSGGRYDGILGITAGVEMLKVLADNWVETAYPVGVVNWTKYVLAPDQHTPLLRANANIHFQRRRCPIPHVHVLLRRLGRRHSPSQSSRTP